MEDTKRLRTKLRLDLNEVEKQISELEKTVKKDKSEENIQALQKLKDYEKKLKDEYEKMTGISVDQATTLKETKIPSFSQKEGFTSKFFGLLAGLTLFNAFYNLALHGIVGFNPNDLVKFYQGTGTTVSSFRIIPLSIRYQSSEVIVMIPLILSALFALLSAFTTKKGSMFLKLLSALGLTAMIGFFYYITILPKTEADVVTKYEDNYFLFAFLFVVAGFLILMDMMDNASGFSKLFTFLSGALMIAAGVQMLIIYVTQGDLLGELLTEWPWVMLSVMASGISYALSSFFR